MTETLLPTGEFIVDARREADPRGHWEHVISRVFVPMNVRLDDAAAEPFRARVKRHQLHDIGLVDAWFGPCSGTRTRPRVIETPKDYIAAFFVRHGREGIGQQNFGSDEERVMLADGEVLIYGTEQPMTFDMPAVGHKQILLVPRQALEEVTGTTLPTSGIFLPGSHPSARLLINHFDALLEVHEQLSPAATLATRHATVHLLASVMHPDGLNHTMEAAPGSPLDAMQRWIDVHLLDPDLVPAKVAAAHAMSLRTAQRIFQASGQSLAAYIRGRRLDRARQALLSSVPIIDIAHRYGFCDAGHFSRAFKAEYGVAPSAYRERWKRPEA